MATLKNRLLIAFFLLIQTGLFSCAGGKASYSGLGSESIDGDLVKKFAPPTLPREFLEKVQRYLDLRSPIGAELSVDGKTLFYNWRVTGVQQVWKLTSPKGYPVQMTGGADPTFLKGLTPDGKYIILSRDRGGEENPGLYLQRTTGGPLITIQHLPKVRTLFSGVSQDSKWLYYAANDQKSENMTLYRYEISSRQKEVILAEEGSWEIIDIHPNGSLLLSKETSNITNAVWEWDPKTKQKKALFGQDEKEEYQARFGEHPNTYLVVTPKGGNFRRLFKYSKSEWTALSPEKKIDISSLEVDLPHKKYWISWNDQGYSRLENIDPTSGKVIFTPRFPGADQIRLSSVPLNSRYVTITVESAKLPKTTSVYDFQTQTQTAWFEPSFPELDPTRFASASLEYFPARDGTNIPAFVRRPKKCIELCPVIVEFHGGPEGQSQPSFDLIGQLFVDAGFVFVEPNVRGSDGYGRDWLNSDNGPKRLQVITDIEDISNWIRKNWNKGDLVPKIGVMGGSYGGYSALMAMTKFGGHYDAGASIVGISNLITFLKNTAPYRRALRVAEYGDPEKDHDALVELSPITHLDKLNAPLMIIQGVNDPRVPVGEATQIYNKASSRKVPVELILFADEGHGVSRRENVALTYGHLLRFFKQHLTKNKATSEEVEAEGSE